MKKLITFFLLFIGLTTYSQSDDNQLVVTPSVEKISETEYDLIFNIEIAEDWHLYSQYNPETASLPMTISPAEGQKGYSLNGKATESETETEFSEIWGEDEIFFIDEATLVQRITLTDSTLTKVTLNLDAQICKEYCFPFDEDFTFSLTGEEIEQVVAEVDDKSKSLSQSLNLNLKNTILLENSTSGSNGENQSNSNLFNIFVLGFIGGLLAFLTPCVFPMVPLTVSFFTKRTEKKGKGIGSAVLYGFFIVLIYGLISLPFHFLDTLDPEILNNISTNVWLNLFFFVVLVFFAGSFFGFYELTLPSSWSNKADSASNVGGILGIFFMALTLALVSFSCTGPILGSLLAGALTSDGGAWQLTAGMGGFGFALALPFTLFAAFPALMTALPKSGGWLNSVKVILGFLEVAAAFKFLSNADLVSHWGLLKVEPLLLIWIATFIGLGLYLFGKIKFPHDSPIKKLGLVRIGLGVASIAFVGYMTTGLMYNKEVRALNSLSLLSGFAPPACYSVFYPCDCPQNLSCVKDYEQGIELAQQMDKPILLDFTGYACVNCRKMEEQVWNQPKVFDHLSTDYVLISLYVDDKEKLEKPIKTVIPTENGPSKITLRTVGNKWATFQTVMFENNSQPLYVLLNSNGRLLSNPVGYTPDENEYRDYLQCGLEQNKKLSAQAGK